MAVYLPGRFFHLLDIQHPDLACHSLFLTGMALGCLCWVWPTEVTLISMSSFGGQGAFIGWSILVSFARKQWNGWPATSKSITIPARVPGSGLVFRKALQSALEPVVFITVPMEHLPRLWEDGCIALCALVWPRLKAPGRQGINTAHIWILADWSSDLVWQLWHQYAVSECLGLFYFGRGWSESALNFTFQLIYIQGGSKWWFKC